MEQEIQQELQNVQKYIDFVIEFFISYGFQVLSALIILAIGLFAAKKLSNFVYKLLEKRHMDITLSKFIASIVKVLVIVFVAIVVIGKFGISITPLIAALSALAFGCTFAIAGPLSNFGAGLSIILSRPFVVEDTITIKNYSGVVEEIKLGATYLTTEDNERIQVPNKQIVGEILVNSFANKVVESVIGISYSDDPQKAIDIVFETLKGVENVVAEPHPQIGIHEFAESSINIGIRYWVPTRQYFQTMCKVNLEIYKNFNDAGITIPFPQRDVHLKEARS